MSAWLQIENVARWIGAGDGIGNIYAVERSSDVRASNTIKEEKITTTDYVKAVQCF
jgi:hypothetical protein